LCGFFRVEIKQSREVAMSNLQWAQSKAQELREQGLCDLAEVFESAILWLQTKPKVKLKGN
jgi:hypothetical protein